MLLFPYDKKFYICTFFLVLDQLVKLARVKPGLKSKASFRETDSAEEAFEFTYIEREYSSLWSEYDL